MVTCHLAPALPKHHIHYMMNVPGPWWGGRCCSGQIAGQVLNGVTGSWTCRRLHFCAYFVLTQRSASTLKTFLRAGSCGRTCSVKQSDSGQLASEFLSQACWWPRGTGQPAEVQGASPLSAAEQLCPRTMPQRGHHRQSTQTFTWSPEDLLVIS